MKKRNWVDINLFCVKLWGPQFTGGLIAKYYINSEFYISDGDLENMRKDYNNYIFKINKNKSAGSKTRHFHLLIEKLTHQERVRIKKLNSLKFIGG